MAVDATSERGTPRCSTWSDGSLITLDVRTQKHEEQGPLCAILGTGASNNFVRAQSLSKIAYKAVSLPYSQLSVRLATGTAVKIKKQIARICFSYGINDCEDDFIILDLDEKFDVIHGIPPQMDWQNRSAQLSPPSGRPVMEAR